jgi:hypothetical protein
MYGQEVILLSGVVDGRGTTMATSYAMSMNSFLFVSFF